MTMMGRMLKYRTLDIALSINLKEALHKIIVDSVFVNDSKSRVSGRGLKFSFS